LPTRKPQRVPNKIFPKKINAQGGVGTRRGTHNFYWIDFKGRLTVGWGTSCHSLLSSRAHYSDKRNPGKIGGSEKKKISVFK